MSKEQPPTKGSITVPPVEEEENTAKLQGVEVQNAEAIKLFDLASMKTRVKLLEKELSESQGLNADLTLQLLKQKSDEEDVYYFLHKKLDQNHEISARLEAKLAASEQALQVNQRQAQETLEEQKRQYEAQIEKLHQRLNESQLALDKLSVFQQQKDETERRVDTLEHMLMREKQNHQTAMEDHERHYIVQKNKLKHHMLSKIKETKQNLLALTDDQLHMTTKRTILENEQMIGELQYQSKESDKLFTRLQAFESQNADLRHQLQLHQDMELELAKKSKSQQKVIQKLKERLMDAELSGFDQSSAVEHTQEQIVALSTNLKQVQAHLDESQAKVLELKHEMGSYHRYRREMLRLQDDSIGFLLQALDDCRERRPSDEDWTKLSELSPTSRAQVLETLLQKLTAYQQKIVQLKVLSSTSGARTDTRSSNVLENILPSIHSSFSTSARNNNDAGLEKPLKSKVPLPRASRVKKIPNKKGFGIRSRQTQCVVHDSNR